MIEGFFYRDLRKLNGERMDFTEIYWNLMGFHGNLSSACGYPLLFDTFRISTGNHYQAEWTR